MATQTIVLSKNKLQYKEEEKDYVRFNFAQNQITANASILSATGDLTVAGKSNLSDKLTVSAGGMDLSGNLNITGSELSNFSGNINVNALLDQETGEYISGGVINATDINIQSNTSTGSLFVINGTSANNVIARAKLSVPNASTFVCNGTANVNNTFTCNGVASIHNALTVTGASTLAGLTAGASTLDSLTAGASTLDSLIVKSGGVSNLNGALNVNGLSSLNNGLNVLGASSLQGLTVNSGYASSLQGTLDVVGDSTFHGTLYANGGQLSVLGTSNLHALNVIESAPANLTGTLTVTGKSNLNGGLAVTGDASVAGKLDVTGTGKSTITGNFQVDGDSKLKSLTVTDNLTLTGALEAGASKLASLEVNGASALKGGLGVTGLSTLDGTLTVNSGNLDVTAGNMVLANGHMVVSQGTLTVSNGKTTLAELQAGATTVQSLSAASANISTLDSTTSNLGIVNIAQILNVDSETAHANLNTVNIYGNTVVGTTNKAANLTLHGNAIFKSALEVTDASYLKGALTVDGTTTLKALQVNELASLNSGLGVSGNILANGNVDLDGVVTISQNLNVTGNAIIDKSLIINTGGLTVSAGQSTLGVLNAGGSTLGSLTVTDVSVLQNKLTISANGMDVTGDSTLRGYAEFKQNVRINGDSQLDGKLTAISGKSTLSELEVTGASRLKGTLRVDGVSTFNDKLTVSTGGMDVNGNVTINGDFTVMGNNTVLNTTESIMQDKSITMGSGNLGDASNMSLNMAYKTGDSAFTAGLRRKAGGGFILFKDCVDADNDPNPHTDTLIVDTLECYSDMNLKKNIVTIDGALDKLDGIRGVYHDWINTKQSEDRQIGVIAQEVQAVYPELVHENENGYLSVNYPKLTAVLLQSIKELKAMVLAICAKQA